MEPVVQLLSDGSFESESETHWTLFGLTIFQSNIVRSGAAALKLRRHASGAFQIVELLSGAEYRFQCMVWRNAPVIMEIQKGRTIVASGEREVSTSSFQWTERNLEFSAPGNGRFAFIVRTREADFAHVDDCAVYSINRSST
uniref:Uncharacterized protein n=1 Tax=Rhodosorus marinus TaxID=101924 RepID=A0A7S3E936_9RHOD